MYEPRFREFREDIRESFYVFVLVWEGVVEFEVTEVIISGFVISRTSMSMRVGCRQWDSNMTCNGDCLPVILIFYAHDVFTCFDVCEILFIGGFEIS